MKWLLELLLKNLKIVNLGKVRDLLSEWEKVRLAILGGSVTAFQITLQCEGTETFYLGGVYKEDPQAALKAALRASAARAMAEDNEEDDEEDGPPSEITGTH